MHQSVGNTLPVFDIEDKIKTSPKTVSVSVPVPTGNVKASLWSKFMAGRHFPSNYSDFLYKNRPASGFYLIKLAKNSYDWLSIFSIDVAVQIISSTFINFAIEAYGWSTTLAGIVISFVGITIAIVAPVLSKRYDDKPLFTLGVFLWFVGFILLAISGAGLDKTIAVAIGTPGLFIVAIGGYAPTTIQSIITAQYPKDQQGEVGGVLSQISILSIIPAYPIALLLSYTQSSKATFYWPGMPYAVVNIFKYLCKNVLYTI
jgi:hypothetical protein